LPRRSLKNPRSMISFLHIPYSEEAQWDFGVDVITPLRFDWNRGRQDKSVHPFTTMFWHRRCGASHPFRSRRAASSLFSTMHEGGHALYEQGIESLPGAHPLAPVLPWPVHEIASRACGEHRRPLAALWSLSKPQTAQRPSPPNWERLSGKDITGASTRWNRPSSVPKPTQAT